MKKIGKFTTLLTLTLILTLLLVGCDNNRHKSKSQTNTVPASTTEYSISGRVTEWNEGGTGTGISEAILTFDDGSTITTDADGKWSKTGIKGAVTATVTKDGYKDSEPITFTNVDSNNQIALYKFYTISGRVINQWNYGSGNVTITVTGQTGDFAGTTTTDNSYPYSSSDRGYWSMQNVYGKVLVTPSRSDSTFLSESLSVSEATSNCNFNRIGNQ